jgi:hypothetical protein
MRTESGDPELECADGLGDGVIALLGEVGVPRLEAGLA